jgi:hypothetical protein
MITSKERLDAFTKGIATETMGKLGDYTGNIPDSYLERGTDELQRFLIDFLTKSSYVHKPIVEVED